MKTTYMMFNAFNNVVAYEFKQKYAKNFIKNHPDHYFIMMRGDYICEGFHKYKMSYDKPTKKFKREKL